MKKNVINNEYKKLIKEEARHWGNTAVEEAKHFPPDYKYYSKTLAYQLYRGTFIKKALSYIKWKSRVLELGSYNGWFSLELARKGAYVDAYDVASKAVQLAKSYYANVKEKENLKGTITDHVMDLNNAKFLNCKYDVIVVRSVFHHIIDPDKLVRECKKVLKPNGIIIADDNLTVTKESALVTGGLLFLLPTEIPYHQKPWRVLRKGKVLARTKGLIEAKGTSPFESISGEQSLVSLLNNFETIQLVTFSAFIGSVASQIRLPNILKKSLLNVLNEFDRLLIKIKILRGTSYFFIGKKNSVTTLS